MEESVTYQGLIRQGKETEAHRLLLIQGKDRFGAPDTATEAALVAITDLERLEALATRLLRVNSWEELLTAPKTSRRKPRGKP